MELLSKFVSCSRFYLNYSEANFLFLADHFLAQGVWIVQNLCVQIKDHEGRFNGREAIIKDVTDGKVDVYMPDHKCNLEVDFDQLTPMKPQPGDDVRKY